MNVLEMTRFMLFQMNSIGFKSGEYGGRNTSLILSFSAHCIESFARWERKLSRINTISPLGLFLNEYPAACSGDKEHPYPT